jgi:amino acid transporter
MKLGGCSVKWNTGLILGFGSFFEVIVFFGLGYLSLGLCMAEMISVMAFDGGYYGYARVLISPLGGYLVGCSGLIESVFYFAIFPLNIARCFRILFNLSDIYQPLVLFLVYLFLFCSFLMIQSKFWSFISFSSCVVIALFAVFLFGSVPQMDYRKYAIINSGKSATEGVQLEAVPVSVLFFMTFDLISLTSSQVENVSTACYPSVYPIKLFPFLLCFSFFTCSQRK